MGLLDHGRTWRFVLSAPPDACLAAFESVMAGGPGFRIRAVKWSIRREMIPGDPGEEPAPGSIATYERRAGLAAVGTGIFGSRAEATEAGAVGSELTFTALETGPGKTECSLWLSTAGKTLGFTNDAGYFRGYMASVEQRLRTLDAGLQTSKA